MIPFSRQRVIAVSPFFAAVALQLWVMFVESAAGITSFDLALFIWTLLPYCLAAWVAVRGTSPWPGFIAGVVAFLFDLFIFQSVFLAPEGSTAALALLFAPLWNLVLFVPAALLIGRWAFRDRTATSPAL